MEQSGPVVNAKAWLPSLQQQQQPHPHLGHSRGHSTSGAVIAVPPCPRMNPGLGGIATTPNAQGEAYYDPYRGPVPWGRGWADGEPHATDGVCWCEDGELGAADGVWQGVGHAQPYPHSDNDTLGTLDDASENSLSSVRSNPATPLLRVCVPFSSRATPIPRDGSAGCEFVRRATCPHFCTGTVEDGRDYRRYWVRDVCVPKRKVPHTPFFRHSSAAEDVEALWLLWGY
ncbi:hypothetical protein B0H14DRAFT_2638299 [Mycena olivaceomarginata]|nr:hypothetical protein B0H14DRAFT_2638299 [Mycena olivaceomarginata]